MNSSIKKEFAQCSRCDCGGERFIVNRTHFLCEEKNRERLDGQKSPEDRQKRVSKIVSMHTIRGISKKQLKSIRSKKKVYDEIDSESDGICKGCGKSGNLSHSHLVPISFNKSLEDEKDNITEHCILGVNGKKGCHDVWESGTKDELMSMLDIDYNIEVIKRLDPKYHKIIISRLNRDE